MSVGVAVECSCTSTGEGPHWDDVTQTLLYVDIETGDVHRYCPDTQKDASVHLDKSVSFVVPCKAGGYVIGLGQSIARMEWDTGSRATYSTVVEVESDRGTRFNDGKCDPSARLWAGTMAHARWPELPELNQGNLYCLGTDGSLTTRVAGATISNGMAWTPDKQTMFYIESISRKVMAYDFDDVTGVISKPRVAVNFGENTVSTLGYPDGMTIDREGKLWVACFMGGRVIRFDPETGQTMTTIEFPVRRTTSCCFGGKHLDELYVTSGTFEGTTKDAPLDGSVFCVKGLGVI